MMYLVLAGQTRIAIMVGAAALCACQRWSTHRAWSGPGPKQPPFSRGASCAARRVRLVATSLARASNLKPSTGHLRAEGVPAATCGGAKPNGAIGGGGGRRAGEPRDARHDGGTTTEQHLRTEPRDHRALSGIRCHRPPPVKPLPPAGQPLHRPAPAAPCPPPKVA